MQEAIFLASTDLEIGDKVEHKVWECHTWTIYDIRTIQYLKEGSVEFEFLLEYFGNYLGWLKRDEIIYPIRPKGNSKQGLKNY